MNVFMYVEVKLVGVMVVGCGFGVRNYGSGVGVRS